jgi:hypothetical protein
MKLGRTKSNNRYITCTVRFAYTRVKIRLTSKDQCSVRQEGNLQIMFSQDRPSWRVINKSLVIGDERQHPRVYDAAARRFL